MRRASEISRLKLALGLTSVYFIVEFTGGLLTNSLALLSDAGHMLSDIGGLSLSLFAFLMAKRPVSQTRTFGYHRAEILAALFNGLFLWLVVGVIFHEAYQRYADPPEVQSLGMLVVSSIGLVINLAVGFILYGSHRDNLNIHGAFLHVLGDLLGSVGAVVAGIVMLSTGWYVADPLAGFFIGMLILYISWILIKESASILMQSVPKGISLVEVQNAMEQVEGVHKVHDLHIWTVTSGIFTLSAHALINGKEDPEQTLTDLEVVLKERFRIEHTTIQLETEDRTAREYQHF